ncbi:CYTH domain-containing protein [Cupriavidus sp. D39]|uniref:CYTH domain-containing protein n=1 Tax=Cupriavidus sp. D39 TaxID=2997877 RepID=UPI00227068E9|nr:CYTH domain-containing protein [Cupriavidus sp. D39]MCY0853959.1 CYTH domain-containing protein [Cupriavidus sp. D39]
MERELKLELVEGKVDQLRGLPLLKSLRTERPHSEHLVSTYFDTPDLYLHCHHVSLRVRKTGNHHAQTLKTQGSTRAGLYERDEFEAPIEGEAPDLDVLRSVVPKGSVAGKLIGGGQLVGRLVPVFTTNVQRTVSLLRLPQGDEVELALDDGTVQADNANAAFQEVEMELKAGEPGHLYDLALGLLDAVPLRISRRSKGERGYALIASEQLRWYARSRSSSTNATPWSAPSSASRKTVWSRSRAMNATSYPARTLRVCTRCGWAFGACDRRWI